MSASLMCQLNLTLPSLARLTLPTPSPTGSPEKPQKAQESPQALARTGTVNPDRQMSVCATRPDHAGGSLASLFRMPNLRSFTYSDCRDRLSNSAAAARLLPDISSAASMHILSTISVVSATMSFSVE